MKYILLFILSLPTVIYSNVRTLNLLDINEKNNRILVNAAQFDSSEAFLADSYNIKINSILEDLNILNQIVNLTPYRSWLIPVSDSSIISSSALNIDFNAIKNEIDSILSSFENLELYNPQLLNNNISTFMTYPEYEEGTMISPSIINDKFNILFSNIDHLLTIVYPESQSCKSILISHPEIEDGMFRLKASDNSHYTTMCLFDNGEASTLIGEFIVDSANPLVSISGWEYGGQNWISDSSGQANNLDISGVEVVKTGAWHNVAGSELTLYSGVSLTKVTTILNINSTTSDFFELPDNTTCTAVVHQPLSPWTYAPDTYIQSDDCTVNLSVYNSFNGGLGWTKLRTGRVAAGDYWFTVRGLGVMAHTSDPTKAGQDGGTSAGIGQTEGSFLLYIKDI